MLISLFWQNLCHNFVRVLIVYDGEVFTCGTNAFSPECSWRKVSIDLLIMDVKISFTKLTAHITVGAYEHIMNLLIQLKTFHKKCAHEFDPRFHWH